MVSLYESILSSTKSGRAKFVFEEFISALNKINDMKNLSDYISEGYDMLGHVIKVGDWIQFQSGGLKLWGEVEEIIPGDKEKYVIKTLGWYGDESQRSQVKLSYKVNANSRSLYLLNKIKK